ncbi:MAG: hypothetical protein QOJ64_1016 [Acidobacteriota bacterium]|jgi:hypothetical protein|nr:hypothetical protein [Acidobacteriota bacterium]
MDTQKLQAMLGGLSGHLIADSPEQELEVERLNQRLARSLLPEDIGQTKRSNFAFENADLFFASKIPSARADSIRTLAQRRTDGAEEPDFRIFVREVPVRSTQLFGSTPLWAGGAAIESTLGPFRRADGRLFWFDFVRIERLVALYIQGKPDPALLFKISTRSRFVERELPLVADASSSYNLSAGSIWINSQLLAPNAPSNYYTGLTIEGGTVSLNTAPQTISNKLTAASSTVVRVSLRLRQPALTGEPVASPYGVDARDATLKLPDRFSFHFSGTSGGTIDEVGRAEWKVYGSEASFRRDQPRQPVYDDLPHRVLIHMTCSEEAFEVSSSRSPFHTLSGRARIDESAWALPAAPIDIANPSPASGIGGLLIKCEKGLNAVWQGMKNGGLDLNHPYILAETGRISVSDLLAKGMFAQQTFELWRDAQNPYGTTIEIQYPEGTPYTYLTFAAGDELLMALGNADVRVDRPVTVTGEPPQVRSKKSLLILAVSETRRLIYLMDDNVLADNLDPKKKPMVLPRPISLALNNALFKVTPVNGCLLFGRLEEDLVKVFRGNLFLTFGLYAYLPTLPDPYAANLHDFIRGQSRSAFNDRNTIPGNGDMQISLWLVSQVKWRHSFQSQDHQVDVSFHFAPLQSQFGNSAGVEALFTDPQEATKLAANGLAHFQTEHDAAEFRPQQSDEMRVEATGETSLTQHAAVGDALRASMSSDSIGRNTDALPNYVAGWNSRYGFARIDAFALLDVSTNADLLGVSFGLNVFGGRQVVTRTTHKVVETREGEQQMVLSSDFPFQVEGMDVVSEAGYARMFTVPQISWEPVFNLTPPVLPADPPWLMNYYPDDGGPTYIVNNSQGTVALAPIPLTDFLVDSFDEAGFFALAFFGLPFGMKALAMLCNTYSNRDGTRVGFNSEPFANEITGARQLRIDGGVPEVEGQGRMFVGSTVQLNNVLNMAGTAQGASTLGQSVTEIFNGEFFNGDPLKERGVPLTRVDISGYGASIFSNWLNPKAPLASTSQAKFDVFVGRCAHEIIQVVSILYPWGIKVVRTITLRRAANGYEFRVDSGWKAESDGRFDFRHYGYVPIVPTPPPDKAPFKTIERESFYEIHPGVIKGLVNVKDIKETTEILPFAGQMTIQKNEMFLDQSGKLKENKNGVEYIDSNGIKQTATGNPLTLNFLLQPVYFNADVEIEDPVSGFAKIVVNGEEKKVVASKKILGFVQTKPLGQPLTVSALHALIERQGTIGAPIDCNVDIATTGQQMRVNRFDVSNSVAADSSSQIFVVSARGNVILPKEGSWGMVKHEHATGEVSPVPQEFSVPLIRTGKLTRQGEVLVPVPSPANELLRVANTTEILRPPQNGTLNYGFLFTSDTQKALFLNPAFKHSEGARLLSKIPPLFADAFRICNSKAIFPNVGNAITSFGDVISLDQGGSKFEKLGDVYKLMQINDVVSGVKKEGYKLLKKVTDFELPNTEWELIELDSFRIYIEYKADKVKKANGGTQNMDGSLNFDVNSFANNVADSWKSRMSNVGIVVDLNGIKRLMTIKGNWDAKKGSEAQYGGSSDPNEVMQPQIEFADELQPIIDILEILQDLQGENYKDAFQKGLRLAMSNKAGTWEYKFEAAKEIPVIRFPPPLLDSPTAPLKLEAGLKIGAYFNAALQVPVSPTQLLPTAGGFIGFYGKLSVMCVSLAAATIYAVGQVELDIAADTKVGPSLRMKFGFGAQIVVGLPVVGNVSVLYMVGVEMYLDSNLIQVSAFMLFQGRAELLGGLVSVTITIEAKGTVSRQLNSGRTDLAAQVTFGIDISIFLIIDISFSESWEESRQIA